MDFDKDLKPGICINGDGNGGLALPFLLPADHYFFVPYVQVSGGEFYWLSAPKPIVAPGTPFSPDLQTWIRNENLDPDWLRVGTDIIGPGTGGVAPTFNGVFSLEGGPVPEPATILLCAAGAFAGLAGRRRSTTYVRASGDR